MAHGFVHYTCCLIVLTVCVDRGDGRWKKKDKENLQDDIELFTKMADKIQHEIEDFYDEYSSKRLKERILDSLLQKYKSNIVSYSGSKNFTLNHRIKQGGPSNLPQKINVNGDRDSRQSKDVHADVLSDTNDVHIVRLGEIKGPKWPKFEDILLEMGKRYDWKNDRWLKVKVKLKDTETNKISDNNIDFHEKHKFHYKIVKLDKSKNRRNVVVAVSAVR